MAQTVVSCGKYDGYFLSTIIICICVALALASQCSTGYHSSHSHSTWYVSTLCLASELYLVYCLLV